jgi:hypothetical protein
VSHISLRQNISSPLIRTILKTSIRVIQVGISSQIYLGVLNTQGMTILINMFFAPAVVAALAIANTVKNAALSFVQNFRLGFYTTNS